MTIRVLIVDDHRILRDGLRSILANEPEVEVVDEAADGRRAIQLVRQLVPDVVVMDIRMPNLNGIEATRQIAADHPDVKVIALSMYSDKPYILRMLDAGASGYVMKNSACDELIRAIRAVIRDHTYLSPEITGVLIENCRQQYRIPDQTPYELLGTREREVLQLLAEGRTSNEIAILLHIASKTVETHRRNLMKKLDLHTIAELTKFAVREGLTSLD